MCTVVDLVSTAVNLDEGLESPSLRGWRRGANSGRSIHYLTSIKSGGACQQRFANGSGPQPPITTTTDNHLRLRTRQGVLWHCHTAAGGTVLIGSETWWLSLSGSAWLCCPYLARASFALALGDFAPSDAAISTWRGSNQRQFHMHPLPTACHAASLLPQPPDSIA